MEHLSDEFPNAMEIDRPCRCRIDTGHDKSELLFSFRAMNGQIQSFKIDDEKMPALVWELQNLSLRSRFLGNGHSLDDYYPTHLPGEMPVGNDGLYAPYVGSYLKMQRVRILLNDLLDHEILYSQNLALTAEEVNREGGIVRWEVKFSNPPPNIIPILIGDIAHNLRSALDVLVCDLARRNNASTDRLAFPFAESEKTLQPMLKQLRPVIGDPATDAIAALRPFKGGDRALRGLHDLNIIDKHRLIVPTYHAVWHERSLEAVLRNALLRNWLPGVPHKTFIVDLGDAGTLVQLRDGVHIQAEVDEDPLQNLTRLTKRGRGVESRFAESIGDLAFGGMPVLETLASLSEMTSGIIVQFRDRFPVTYRVSESMGAIASVSRS